MVLRRSMCAVTAVDRFKLHPYQGFLTYDNWMKSEVIACYGTVTGCNVSRRV